MPKEGYTSKRPRRSELLIRSKTRYIEWHSAGTLFSNYDSSPPHGRITQGFTGGGLVIFDLFLRNKSVPIISLSLVKNYKGINPSENILRNVESLLNLSEPQLEIAVERFKDTVIGNLSLKKCAVPLLESKFALMSAFDQPFQNRLLEIRTHLGMLNEEVDQARFYFQLTFTDMPSINHGIARENLSKRYQEYSFRAKVIIDHIGQIQW